MEKEANAAVRASEVRREASRLSVAALSLVASFSIMSRGLLKVIIPARESHMYKFLQACDWCFFVFSIVLAMYHPQS